MSIDVIFLGLDGVLFDTEALHLAACNAAFANAGLSVRWTLPALRAAAATHGIARAIASAVAMPPLSRDKQRVAELLEEKQRQFHLAILARPPQAQAAALALIEDATAAGSKVCILTDLPAPSASALLERQFGADVNSLFSVVAGGVNFDSVGAGPYAHALHAIGAAPHDAIAIDTAVPALRAAADAGLWTVSVAPYGTDVVRPRQFITFDALHELQASPYTPDQQRPKPGLGRAA
ncbi:HAD family hydrolase [Duganella sp. FT135W]|uniref:HAD family hydrolase n=1 Tax=Duganella flavida TaxID=2692175 RepID=A0A6L8KBE7_9BURK|nr:HAD family hydrolase [Duganella flavida]MYM24809.1 HAD family hydrolase [Duganella flavida]